MTTNPELVALLAKTPVFAGLDEAGCAAVAAEMREVSFSASQVIFGRGDAGREIYLVTHGRVRLSVLTAEGRELSFAHAEPGALFGEIAMLDGDARTADATAVSKTTAYTLTKSSFLRLIETHPEISEAMLLFLCRRIREADQQLEAIALYPIEVRLARFFLAAAQAKAGDEAEGTVTIPFTMSQTELALLIGASRPKVNTALSLLESNGALKRSGREIVCNIEELEMTADG